VALSIDQAVIAVFGVAAVWLSQDSREKFRRWAPVCGLISQSAWLYASYTAQQWGVLALTVLYTVAWANGMRTYWFKKPNSDSLMVAKSAAEASRTAPTQRAGGKRT
jgi:hypothetical protein